MNLLRLSFVSSFVKTSNADSFPEIDALSLVLCNAIFVIHHFLMIIIWEDFFSCSLSRFCLRVVFTFLTTSCSSRSLHSVDQVS